MSMITATAWVPRGVAAPHPKKYKFDEEEYDRISRLARLELAEAQDDLKAAKEALVNNGSERTASTKAGASTSTVSGDMADPELAEYDMEHYDDDDDEANGDGDGDDPKPNESIFGNIKGLAYYEDESEDPYLTLPAQDGASDDEEREELQIFPKDNLILAVKIEDEVAGLEVFVHDDAADSLYVHHDVMLPAIPLCVEWLDARPNQSGDTGNFAAVGTMDPDIELWDLDIVDCMFPTAILGQNTQKSDMPMQPATKKKKNKKTKTANAAYHVDSVLALAANRTHRNLLASASADKTTKLWDLNTCTAAHSYTHHTDKVCTLSWHPTQSSVLLSGSYDRTIIAADMRAPNSTPPRWGVESDVEQVRWDPHDEHKFYVSTETGLLHCFDARKLPSSPEQSKPLWRLQAHEKSLSSFSLHPVVPGFIATASTDRTVKLWDLAAETGPSMIVNRDLGVGKVFSVNFAPDEEVAFRLAVAGSKGAVQVWDTSTNKAVREAFATRVKTDLSAEAREEKVVGLEHDDEMEREEEEAAEAEANGGEGGWESMEED